MQIDTLSRSWKKVLLTNSTATSFASKVYTTTEPTNDGVIDLTAGGPGAGIGGIVPQYIMMKPYGLGSSNDGFSMRVIGWTRIGTQVNVSTSVLLGWDPSPFAEFACLLGATGGVAGSAVINTELFCDTITPVAAKLPNRVIAAGTAINSDVRIYSPADDTAAFIIMPIWGFEKFEVTWDQTTNTPSMNCLYKFV